MGKASARRPGRRARETLSSGFQGPRRVPHRGKDQTCPYRSEEKTRAGVAPDVAWKAPHGGRSSRSLRGSVRRICRPDPCLRPWSERTRGNRPRRPQLRTPERSRARAQGRGRSVEDLTRGDACRTGDAVESEGASVRELQPRPDMVGAEGLAVKGAERLRNCFVQVSQV